jgi:predicted nucleic acid-binding protein
MTANVLLDTNVLVYALVVRTGAVVDPRNKTAWDLVAAGGRVSVQALAEFTDVVSRKHKKNWETIAEMLDGIRVLCGPALPLTAEIHTSAIEVSQRYGYRIYDSMMIVAALSAGCTTLFTEDMQHGQLIDGLCIENPFL